MPYILLFLLALISTPLHAVTIPGVTSTPSDTAASEPDAAQKKAAYSALADVLENDTSRKELIEQLRQAAATPPPEAAPTLTPPEVKEEKTVLENVTDVTRHYGGEFATRFAQLWRNISTAAQAVSHRDLLQCRDPFSDAGSAGLCFLWPGTSVRPATVSQNGALGRHKNRDRSNWLQLPAMITGALIIDLLLLALTLFIGQLLSDNLNGGNSTIAFQQSLFLNAFALD